ncbi:hypothetical protein CHELA20_11751 [Hyphomicrobiales bacterium]|nr:hypothetical protein CHELA20_11751 [Hyphomicrobiales bacterium]CAH1689911.1 hypothetical protein CHELA41_50205 [Hyphomicrobiales bacterium]
MASTVRLRFSRARISAVGLWVYVLPCSGEVLAFQLQSLHDAAHHFHFPIVQGLWLGVSSPEGHRSRDQQGRDLCPARP